MMGSGDELSFFLSTVFIGSSSLQYQIMQKMAKQLMLQTCSWPIFIQREFSYGFNTQASIMSSSFLSFTHSDTADCGLSCSSTFKLFNFNYMGMTNLQEKGAYATLAKGPTHCLKIF